MKKVFFDAYEVGDIIDISTAMGGFTSAKRKVCRNSTTALVIGSIQAKNGEYWYKLLTNNGGCVTLTWKESPLTKYVDHIDLGVWAKMSDGFLEDEVEK